MCVFALRRLGVGSSASGTSTESYFRDPIFSSSQRMLEVVTRTSNRWIDNVGDKEKKKRDVTCSVPVISFVLAAQWNLWVVNDYVNTYLRTTQSRCISNVRLTPSSLAM